MLIWLQGQSKVAPSTHKQYEALRLGQQLHELCLYASP